ncbi:MAG: hypothetical protein JO273_15115 [Methylobacteriaceae bacterium]|nr:hypothetical protein [Methylobacteriaceae bacterium]
MYRHSVSFEETSPIPRRGTRMIAPVSGTLVALFLSAGAFAQSAEKSLTRSMGGATACHFGQDADGKPCAPTLPPQAQSTTAGNAYFGDDGPPPAPAPTPVIPPPAPAPKPKPAPAPKPPAPEATTDPAPLHETPVPAPAPPPPAPPAANYADELTDFGVKPQAYLQTNVGSATPLTIPNGRIVTTMQLKRAMDEARGARLIVIDAWEDSAHATISGAYRIPYAGRFGTFQDQTQTALLSELNKLTGRDLSVPLVFFCAGAKCWESYNASLRAMAMGFKNVYWYRGGMAAWNSANLPTSQSRSSSAGPTDDLHQ